jgi:hypothetical protein
MEKGNKNTQKFSDSDLHKIGIQLERIATQLERKNKIEEKRLLLEQKKFLKENRIPDFIEDTNIDKES